MDEVDSVFLGGHSICDMLVRSRALQPISGKDLKLTALLCCLIESAVQGHDCMRSHVWGGIAFMYHLRCRE